MNRQALISLSNKKNIKLICKILNDYKIQIIASDNTYKKIVGLGFKAKRVKNITKYNELFEGRVKTLHPIIHGGILFKRSDIKHYNQAKKNKIRNWIPGKSFLFPTIGNFNRFRRQPKKIRKDWM